jgi:transcriptional regulator with PAS, ATPase and Fis domain
MHPRTRCAITARVEPPGAKVVATEVLDLSESGVRLRAAEGLCADGEIRLQLTLQRGREVWVRARFVRQCEDGSLAFRFLHEGEPAGCAALRSFLGRKRPAPPCENASEMVGRSQALQQALGIVDRVAPTDVTVLLLGETGTGKEMAAHRLHRGSHRAQGPFVAVNCTALPETLIESELFGYEPGAFTGATRRRIGRIEQAARGTLFLDEIGDLSLPAQAKLLRALQQHAIDRIGGGESIPIDVRVVAATNQNLEEAVAKSRFRRDLFFRLNVVAVRLPSLRERRDDIMALADYFLAHAQAGLGKTGIELDEDARAALLRHDWPGNVRELENLVLRLVALTPDGTAVRARDLGLFVPDGELHPALPLSNLREILELCEREIIRRLLDRNLGNRSQTARDLGISRQALQQKLARLRVARP